MIVIKILAADFPDKCRRCVNTPTRTNRPAHGETCRTCGVTNERKVPKFEPAPELAIKVHLFEMVARSHHRAVGHSMSFLECSSGDCSLWHAVVNNARPLR